MAKRNIFGEIQALEKKAGKLAELMAKAIKTVDDSIYEFVDKDVVKYMFENEIGEGIKASVRFQKDWLSIEIIHETESDKLNIVNDFKVFLCPELNNWIDCGKLSYLKDDIKRAEGIMREFLRHDWSQNRRQMIKCTNPILYQDVCINERI